MVNKWKVTAIVFITLFTLLVAWIILGLVLIAQDTAKQEECFYNVCSDYPDAWIEGNICSCYDYDLLGELQVVHTEVIK